MAAEPRHGRLGRVRRVGLGRRGTVRTRTTLAATVIFGLALLVGGSLALTLLHRSLVRNLDDIADIRSDDIAALARRGTLPHTLSLEDDAVGQVVDDRGRVLAASRNVTDAPALTALLPAGDGTTVRTVHDIPGASGSYRVFTLRTTTPDGPVTIYVGTSLETAQDTLFLVRTSLLVGGPLLLALVAAMTWITVGRALQPVEAIRSQVAHLSSKDLHRRVPLSPTDDEIGRLAVTMNAMLDRLQAAADKQKRFVADASHELQSPLAATRADLEVALAHPGATDWPDTARDLLEENGRMERLVADLLFVARTDDAGTPAPGTPVDLHEIVFDEAARLTGAGSSNGLRIDTGGVTSGFVLGRSDDLGRAVRNLLDNARRHARSVVRIELGPAGNGGGDVDSHGSLALALVVEDDGPGVPPEHRARIFERFARLDDARTRDGDGTGLGLAIVREIVEQHGGHIAVLDGSTGRGARFVITLPAD